jgi:hypothetical protein
MKGEYDNLHRHIAEYLKLKSETNLNSELHENDEKKCALFYVGQHNNIIEKTKMFPRGYGWSYDSPKGFSIDWEYISTSFEWTYVGTRITDDSNTKLHVEVGQYTNTPPTGVLAKCSPASDLGVNTLGYIEISEVLPINMTSVENNQIKTYYYFDTIGNMGKAVIKNSFNSHNHSHDTSIHLQRELTESDWKLVGSSYSYINDKIARGLEE